MSLLAVLLQVAIAWAEPSLLKGGCQCDGMVRADSLASDLEHSCANLTSSEQLIPCLPPEMRSNYSLMYDSGSPQCASPASPRLVMFTPDGRSMISFPGRGGKPGCESTRVELVTFNATSRAYEPSTLHFDGGHASFHGPRHEENQKCAQCHGADFHPNWKPYPSWPGAYGSSHSKIKPGSAEARNYRAFLAGAARRPPYSLLQPKPSLTFPFSMTDQTPSPENNATLNGAIERRNVERIVRILKTSPQWNRLKYRLLSGLLRKLNPSLTGCAEFDAREYEDVLGGVSEDFRNERVITNGQMPRDFPRPSPSFYPTREQIASDPVQAATAHRDGALRNASSLLYMARKLGVPEPERFFNRLESDRIVNGRRAFTADRTADQDARMGGQLARTIMQELVASEPGDPAGPLRNRFPFSAYVDPDGPGVDDDLCLAYPEGGQASIAYARRVYGPEECHNGIRAEPVAGGPGICEKLREWDGRVNCNVPGAGPVPPRTAGEVGDAERAARNVGNPLLRCAGCHNGSDSSIPSFPFGDADRLKAALRAPGSSLGSRIIEEVKKRRMPPPGGIESAEERAAIERYVRNPP